MWYERIKYPDGQISAKWKKGQFLEIKITERINSYEDLMFIRSLSDMVGEVSRKRIWLFIPCLFGQRSDKRFDVDQSFDLKLIAEVINNCHFRTVEIFDPHSDVSLALVNNSTRLGPDVYVEKTLTDIESNAEGRQDIILVSPDAGAFKKVFSLGAKYNLPVVGANKHRDLEGNINLTFAGDVAGKICLIVDDLLDGGYTFVVLGNELKKRGAKKVYLYVSHAYFNQGFQSLRGALDGIYCTNSVKDIDDIMIPPSNGDGFVTQYKII